MVPLVADVDADVVQQGAELEPLPFAVGEPMRRARLIEEHQRQPRDLLRVFGPVVAPFGQLDHAAAPDVGKAVGLSDLFAVLGDVVEDQAFAERQVAERKLGGFEPAQNLVEENRARHREIGAAGVESRNTQPLFDVQAGKRSADPP